MKTYLTLFVMVVLAACAAAPKCPVSSDDFASATSDLASLQSEVNDLEAELADAQARGDEMYDLALSYETKNAELESMLGSEPAAVSKTVVAEVEMESISENEAINEKKVAELTDLIAQAEAINAKLEAEAKPTLLPPPPKPVLQPVPPIYGYGISPAPFGASMMPYQPFPAGITGYTYAPPAGSNLNIHISGEDVKDGAYFRVWVNGKEVIWAGEMVLPVLEDGGIVMLPLLPPQADGYVPVESFGPFEVLVQVCYMTGGKCVLKGDKKKAASIKDVSNRTVILHEYD
ncbi:MAG: hypothetical protein PHW53_01295 [Patescibacteria group bacterium]|nr:hypothetical protein [Patescibacteria group bacterium]